MSGNFFGGQFFGGGFFGALESGTQPSGGVPATLRVKGRTRNELAAERARFGIPDAAAEVIAEVAARQVERLERDEQKRFEELHLELTLRAIAWDGRYLEVLSEIRSRMIDEEIAEKLRLKIKGDEELMILMVMAAALA